MLCLGWVLPLGNGGAHCLLVACKTRSCVMRCTLWAAGSATFFLSSQKNRLGCSFVGTSYVRPPSAQKTRMPKRRHTQRFIYFKMSTSFGSVLVAGSLNKRFNIQRRLAWSLRKDDTRNRREHDLFLQHSQLGNFIHLHLMSLEGSPNGSSK